MVDTLRFLSFNIHGARNFRGVRDLSQIQALLDRHDVDIAVLQEVETRPSRGGTLQDIARMAGPDRPHTLQGATLIEGEGWYGNAILSRHPIVRGIVHNLETTVDLEPRNAVDALLATPLGNLRVIGTHLSLSIFERWREAQNLLKLMQAVEEQERSPTFLMGDINEWQRPSRLLRHLNRQMKPLPAGATFPSRFPLFKLDRAWFDSTLLTARAWRLDDSEVRQLSDHLPLLVEVSKKPS